MKLSKSLSSIAALFPVLPCLVLFLNSGMMTPAAEAPQIPEDPENFHIFLLMGQSNMEGGQATDGAMDKEANPRILKLNRWNSWEVAVDPITNNYKVAVGPGLSFAKKLAEENPDVTIGLVPLAVGGTTISEWMKGSSLYQETLSAASIARQNGVIRGILWHQGEHDAIFRNTAVHYDTNLKTLIDQLRVDLGDVELPFIVAGLVNGISQNKNHSQYALVQERLKGVAAEFYKTAYVHTGDLPQMGDNLHFSVNAQHMLGERYADAYLRLNGHWLEKWWMELNASLEVNEEDAESTVDEEEDHTDSTDDSSGSSEDASDSGVDTDTKEDEAGDEMEGWMWSEQLGLFYAENFPFIKHAQLGWLKLNAFADGSLSLESPVFGKFRTLTNHPENAIYIYRENPDPELVHEHGDTYFVNLLAEPGDETTFYNHTLESWQSTIEQSSFFDNVEDLYHMTETQFVFAQEDLARMTTSPDLTFWSDETSLMTDALEHRTWVMLYGNETYNFADENIEGNLREFWMDHALYLIEHIDNVIIEAQERWIQYTDSLYAPSE